MRKLLPLATFVFITFISVQVHAETDDELLLRTFHKYGIYRCDKFILKKSKLEKNWNFFISKHADAIDEAVREVSLIQIYGTKDDNVKIDATFIETKQACFVHLRTRIVDSGPCKSKINLDAWYVSEAMPDKDYNQYTNKGGVQLLAQEITVGNFKACVKEFIERNSSPLE